MKKTNKIVAIIAIILIILSICASVYAGAVDPSTLTGNKPGNSATIEGIGNDIIGVIQIVGSITAVIILLVLGIKYMMGSAEEKAEYKKSMIPYLVGAVLIFAASNIASIIFNMAKDIGKTT